MKPNNLRWAPPLVLAAMLAGCGGGGGSAGTCTGSAEVCFGSTEPVLSTAINPDLLPSSEALAGICSTLGQQRFTRAYLNESYLWYSEVQPANPAFYTTISDYFRGLLSPLLDSTGARKDRFSFITTATNADSQSSGAGYGYGADWRLDSAGRIRVAQVTPGSPAAKAGLARGGELVAITSSGGQLYPNLADAPLTISYRATLGAAAQSISMNTAALQEDPVPLSSVLNTTGGKRAAYVLFNAHIRGAQDKLIDTVLGLRSSGLDALVLDLRYNGGGFIYTALSLATMLGSPASDKKVFERLQFNDKRATETQDSTFFYSNTLQFNEGRYPEGYALPQLSLPRVYVLTTSSTCSASESVINGLRGIDVEVVLVGGTTCGKPYGFSRKDNCGLAYYPIEFQGTNQKGFGDYSAGFVPNCRATDDFEQPLGDAREGMLATALSHVDSGACPVATAAARAAAVPRTDALALSLSNRPQMPGRVLTPRRP